MLLYPQFPADWLTFTEKKLNKKLLIHVTKIRVLLII